MSLNNSEKSKIRILIRFKELINTFNVYFFVQTNSEEELILRKNFRRINF